MQSITMFSFLQAKGSEILKLLKLGLKIHFFSFSIQETLTHSFGEKILFCENNTKYKAVVKIISNKNCV